MASTTGGLRLDADTLAAMERMGETPRKRLEALIAEADRLQRSQLERAVDDAMAIVPAPLRRRVRKMIIG